MRDFWNTIKPNPITIILTLVLLFYERVNELYLTPAFSLSNSPETQIVPILLTVSGMILFTGVMYVISCSIVSVLRGIVKNMKSGNQKTKKNIPLLNTAMHSFVLIIIFFLLFILHIHIR